MLQCNFPAVAIPPAPHHPIFSWPAPSPCPFSRRAHVAGLWPTWDELGAQLGPHGFLSQRFKLGYAARASRQCRMSTCCSSAVKNQAHVLEGCTGQDRSVMLPLTGAAAGDIPLPWCFPATQPSNDATPVSQCWACLARLSCQDQSKRE